MSLFTCLSRNEANQNDSVKQQAVLQHLSRCKTHDRLKSTGTVAAPLIGNVEKTNLNAAEGLFFLQRVAVSGSNLSRYSNCKEEHQETKCKKTKSEIVALLQHQNILWNPGNMLKILLHHQ